MKKIISMAVILLFAVIELNAQSTISAKAKAEITSEISIVDNSGLPGGSTLDFGSLAASTTNGSCTVSTQNVRTTSGGVNPIVSTSTSTASFMVNGTMGRTYTITLPVAGIDVLRAGGSETMSIDNFTARPESAGVDQLTGTLNTQGSDIFTVGGTLFVKANQVEGIYEGTFNVTVAYN